MTPTPSPAEHLSAENLAREALQRIAEMNPRESASYLLPAWRKAKGIARAAIVAMDAARSPAPEQPKAGEWEQVGEAVERLKRHGDNLFKHAAMLGWVAGPEGPLEFLMRRSYQQGDDDRAEVAEARLQQAVEGLAFYARDWEIKISGPFQADGRGIEQPCPPPGLMGDHGKIARTTIAAIQGDSQ